MARTARTKSVSGMYHIMVRGLNKQDIFLDVGDRMRYLDTLLQVKVKSGCQVHAYCLMSNHVHLLLEEGADVGVGEVMQQMGSSYALWFNHKYERLGYLFHDRFRSEPIETTDNVLAVMRYIHQNPVKAGMVAGCEGYVWSSYLAYATGKEHQTGLTDTRKALELCGGTEQFIASHHQLCEDVFSDAVYRTRATPRQMAAAAKRILKDRALGTVKDMVPSERNAVLRELKAIPGATCSQVAYLVGVSKKVVERAVRGAD